jgi:bifunctional non-homologous end joining protein LigD
VIAGAFDIPVERVILDCEIVVVKVGRTSFSELQAELAKGNQDSLLFYAFDLLYLEGFDLRKAPLIERKRILKMLFDETGLESLIIYSEHPRTDGNEMLAHACKLKFEGIISTSADAPYRSEHSDAWIKVKCLQRGKFPVVGFVKDATGVAALHLGRLQGKDLVYSGKVGTGWSRTMSSQIRKKLDSVVTPPRSLLSQSGTRRPFGWIRNSRPKWDTARSPPLACSAPLRSTASLRGPAVVQVVCSISTNDWQEVNFDPVVRSSPSHVDCSLRSPAELCHESVLARLRSRNRDRGGRLCRP